MTAPTQPGTTGPATQPADEASATEPETTGAPAGGDDQDPDGAEQLGEAGKKALDAMKAKWKASRDGLRSWTDVARELGITDPAQLRALLDKTTTAVGSAQTAPDVEKIRREATAAALKAANSRIVAAEVRAAAAGKLADPADALRFLDLDKIAVDDDGGVDPDEIADAIGDLIKTKPYLAATPQKGGSRFQGGADGGNRGGKPQRPKSLAEALTRAARS